MTREESKEKLWATGRINTLSKVECNELINEIYDDFESRTCESCNASDYGNSFCLKLGIRVTKDFLCNKWEAKQ